MKEKKDTSFNLRLSKRQHSLLASMSRQRKITRAKLVRRALFGNHVMDEPDYTPEEIEHDKNVIKDKLEAINQRILKEFVSMPLAEREAILSKLSDIESALKRSANNRN